MLNTINRSDLSEQVANLLETAIVNGDYHRGDKFPSENALAKQLGLSRTVTRVALKMLQAKGYLDIHQGKGAVFLGIPQTESAYNLLISKFFEDSRGQNLLQQRYMVTANIFLGAAWLAIQNKTDREWKAAYSIVNKMKKSTHFIQIAEFDRQLYYIIAKMSKNETYIALIDTLITNSKEERDAFFQLEDIHETVVHWEKIVTAIKAEDYAQVSTSFDKLQQGGYERIVKRLPPP